MNQEEPATTNKFSLTGCSIGLIIIGILLFLVLGFMTFGISINGGGLEELWPLIIGLIVGLGCLLAGIGLMKSRRWGLWILIMVGIVGLVSSLYLIFSDGPFWSPNINYLVYLIFSIAILVAALIIRKKVF